MSVLLINDYLREIARLRQFSGASTEKVISEAFKDLLKAWARSAGLHFIPQHDFQTALNTRVIPDGAVLHDLRVPLGWWEAKDTADDLDVEIGKKLKRGYPRDNIVFENSHTAVLHGAPSSPIPDLFQMQPWRSLRFVRFSHPRSDVPYGPEPKAA